jgi:hypothetical protein
MERDARNGLMVRVVWFDDEIIELEWTVEYRGFRGTATCYTTSGDVVAFADALHSFSESSCGSPAFHAALDDGSKRVSLRAYTVDLAAHLAVHVSLATDNVAQRPESVWKIELELLTESWPMSRFAAALRSAATTRSGEAFLAVREQPATRG